MPTRSNTASVLKWPTNNPRAPPWRDGGANLRLMKIRDKKIKQAVSVADARCLKCTCYWPRPDPGAFTQGQGYRSRPGKKELLCGTREIHGCPTRAVCCNVAYAEYETRCGECGKELNANQA